MQTIFFKNIYEMKTEDTEALGSQS